MGDRTGYDARPTTMMPTAGGEEWTYEPDANTLSGDLGLVIGFEDGTVVSTSGQQAEPTPTAPRFTGASN